MITATAEIEQFLLKKFFPGLCKALFTWFCLQKGDQEIVKKTVIIRDGGEGANQWSARKKGGVSEGYSIHVSTFVETLQKLREVG